LENESSSWGFQPGSEIVEGRLVMRELGGGVRYEVFLVWDEDLYSLAVAKVLRPSFLEDAEASVDLRREADILRSLAHPMLLRAFDVVLDGPHPHVLLEYVDGPLLRTLIRRSGPLPLEQLLPLALHVAAVLHYLHRRGVVHLDVKPRNVVMGIPPRLIDLSLARSFDSAARLGGPIGTDAYMAPEQIEAATRPGEIGPATDIWGLGATLYEAITGAVPFLRRAGERFPQLVEEPAPLTRIPPELGELVLAMLAKSPSERPTVDAVALALQPLVEKVPGKPRLPWRRGR
jgi:eukaryotic-like serine/threonine-protein kinase